MSGMHVQRDWEKVRDEILAEPRASSWLASGLRSALGRDPLSVANDAELLVAILRGRCRGGEDDVADAVAPRSRV